MVANTINRITALQLTDDQMLVILDALKQYPVDLWRQEAKASAIQAVAYAFNTNTGPNLAA